MAFIDADCTAEEGWLNAIWRNLSAEGAARIIGGDVRIPRATPGQPPCLEAYESVYAYRQQEYIEKKGFSGTGNLAMCREIFEVVGPFGGIEIAEDRDWGQRAGELGFKTKYVPDTTVYHPARRTLKELLLKWDRHISHDFQETTVLKLGYARWLAYVAAVIFSPVFELLRVVRSNRISGVGETVRLCCCEFRKIVSRKTHAWFAIAKGFRTFQNVLEPVAL